MAACSAVSKRDTRSAAVETRPAVLRRTGGDRCDFG